MPLEAPVITTVASRRLSMITLLLSPTLGRRTARYVWRYYPQEGNSKNLVLGIAAGTSPRATESLAMGSGREVCDRKIVSAIRFGRLPRFLSTLEIRLYLCKASS
jgi:hypothetical protein